MGDFSPLLSYFPQEIFYELWLSTTESNAAPAASADTPTSESGENSGATAAADPDDEGSKGAPAKPRFNVIHKIRYTPSAPSPNDEKIESQVVGRYLTLREANEGALKEVYEKYGGLAHMSLFQPPKPSWIQKAGGGWPNTWKLEDGRLQFSVVNSRLCFTLKGEISVVKAEEE